jgi:putative aminopeptidase FrvX
MPFLNYDRLFDSITELVMHHSPSGMESAVDSLILQKFADLGLEAWLDEAGNAIAKIPGVDRGRSLAITAHKDEIGAIVKQITYEGKIKVQRLGGAFPWVYGEGVVDLLGDRATISGILCFGSRHVSHQSPQKVYQEERALKWEDVWIETKCSWERLELAGIRPGTRVVVGKQRKHPIRLENYIGSYTLDNKASVAILLALAEIIKKPAVDIYLVASAKEEVGAIGALYFTQRHKIDALIALEICPLSSEYPIEDGEAPVILSQDSYGMYDEGLNLKLQEVARSGNIPLQIAILNSFGSDASIAMKFGHVAKAACLAFPTQNTHGYEIAHLGAIANCCHLLSLFCDTRDWGLGTKD